MPSTPTSAPSKTPTKSPTRRPTSSPTPYKSQNTVVYYDTYAIIDGVSASDFDNSAQQAFLQVSVDGMDGVSISDVNIKSVEDAVVVASSSLWLRKLQFWRPLDASSKTHVTFATHVIMENFDDEYSDPYKLAANLQAQLTTAYADPSISQEWVDLSLSTGSTSALNAEDIVFEVPTFGDVGYEIVSLGEQDDDDEDSSVLSISMSTSLSQLAIKASICMFVLLLWTVVYFYRQRIDGISHVPAFSQFVAVAVGVTSTLLTIMTAADYARGGSADSATHASALFLLVFAMGIVSVIINALTFSPCKLRTLSALINQKPLAIYSSFWAAICLLATLNLEVLLLLPWKESEFTIRSEGYPRLWYFRLVVYLKIFSSLMNILITLTAPLASESAQFLFFISVFSTLHGAVTVFIRLSAQSIQKYDVTLVVKEDHDVAMRELSDLRSISSSLTLSPLSHDIEQDMEISPDESALAEEKGVYSSRSKFADETLNMLKKQVKASGQLPLEFIPLGDIRAELELLMSLVNEGKDYDEGRLDHLLRCMEHNDEYIAEKKEVIATTL
jgi:hypothetical protein